MRVRELENMKRGVSFHTRARALTHAFVWTDVCRLKSRYEVAELKL